MIYSEKLMIFQCSKSGIEVSVAFVVDGTLNEENCITMLKIEYVHIQA